MSSIFSTEYVHVIEDTSDGHGAITRTDEPTEISDESANDVMREVPVPTGAQLLQALNRLHHFMTEEESKRLEIPSPFPENSFGYLHQTQSDFRAEQTTSDWDDWTQMTEAEFDAWSNSHFGTSN